VALHPCTMHSSFVMELPMTARPRSSTCDSSFALLVRVAEDFISYCASASSVSGRPYEIRFPDGQVVLSADFLRQELLEFDKENATPS